jgi:hypothetical protein
MSEQSFSPEDSIQVIRDMISQTKDELSYDSFYLLLWGWLIILICVVQFVLLDVFKSPYHYLAWSLIWIGIVATAVRIIVSGKKAKVRTYVGEAMKYIWLGMWAAFMVLGCVCAILGWNAAFPLYIILYGVGTFSSGGLLRFKPLMIGGASCWGIAIVAALLPYDLQIIAGAVAILFSYIIPGHMLRYRQIKKRKLEFAS